ncbi:hypothetical protein [Mesonia aquimarina]|uniref:hypothetical protein n=1 Tax=Mesonia aquimarina TaxID=1504967 RepID=UPI000EF62757|nr:hypothetical protein [Mesonia aquimarina]
MTRKEAKLADKLLLELVKKENKDRLSWVNIHNLNFSEADTKKLIQLTYLIRREQNELPDKLITGSNVSLRPNEPHINDFKASGGFYRIYKQRKKQRLVEILKISIAIITLAILTYSTFIKNSQTEKKIKSESIESLNQNQIKNETPSNIKNTVNIKNN